VSARASIASGGSACAACVTISSRRFGTRSAIRPPKAPSSSIGTNWSAVTKPTATPEPVSVSTTQISATICIQLPDSDASWPTK
jgi:hypothetical protein